MQNNPANNPYDEMFNNLARIVDEIVKNLPNKDKPRIIGYTIITRHPLKDMAVYHFGTDEREEYDISYEVIESETHIFITAEIPSELRTAPFADIQQNTVRICVDDRESTILLSNPVDIIHSYYRVHRGVMDITLLKAKKFH